MTRSRPSTRAPNPRQVVLLGHRATGKTTLGRIAAELLDWDFVDLDRRIEERTGKAPEVLVAEDEDAFRRIEREQLQKILDEEDDGGRIISPGAGCTQVPESTLCAWLWRDGWERTAMRSRARLRPDWSFEREIEWMRSTREPLWEENAHLFVEIPRGRTPRFAGQMLASYLAWATAIAQSPLARRTWIVPNGPDQLDRAARDCAGLGLAGIEIRSDHFADAPRSDRK
ncbi:MAG: shikimate kinase, partial [Persicimonas sp.]